MISLTYVILHSAILRHFSPLIMIGNSVFDYLNIRICISALRLVAPASILYLACCAINPRYFVLPVALYTASEASFYLFVYLPRRSRLQLASPSFDPLNTLTQSGFTLAFIEPSATPHARTEAAPIPQMPRIGCTRYHCVLNISSLMVSAHQFKAKT